jgi:predicted permease
MENLLQDIRYAARLFAKSPGFTCLAVAALALGIGANTAIFSLINSVLLRPPGGIQKPGRLVMLERVQNGALLGSFSRPDYLDYAEQTRTLTGLAASCRTPVSFSDGDERPPLRIRGELVSGNYFSILGARPALGRLLLPSDDGAPGAHPVAVLSFGFWQRVLGSDPNVVGTTIDLNGYGFAVVGIAAPDFNGIKTGQESDVWVPVAMQPQTIPRMSTNMLQERNAGWLNLFGRLAPGASVEQAQSELATIARRLEQAYPETNQGRTVAVRSGFGLSSTDRAQSRTFLGLLLGGVFLLLLIACGNVANLLLVRAMARRREIAVRLAIGASRGRLIRQLLTEGVLLSLLGGVAGLLIAPWAAGLITVYVKPSNVLAGVDHKLDPRVLGFTLLVSIATGILFGLAPALHASRPELTSSLKDGSPASGHSKSRAQSLLIVSQVALSLVLLIGVGLTVRTMQRILAVDRGFDSRNLLLMSFDLSIQGYTQRTGTQFYTQLWDRLESLPGAVSACTAKNVPPTDWVDGRPIFREGEAAPPEQLKIRDDLGVKVACDAVSPGYFSTLGIGLLQGREFTIRDNGDSPPVAIASERLARQLWPGGNAIGKRIQMPQWPDYAAGPPVEIVGIARDVPHRSLTEELPLMLYYPVLQNYDGRATLVVRTADSVRPGQLGQAIRDEVASIDKNLPLFGVQTMDDHVADGLWEQRMASGLIGAFGLLALALSGLGLYGVIAHWVGLRRHEIGVRMALGARSRDVVSLVVRHAMLLSALGICFGLAAALALTRLLTGLLFGVSALDPAIFTASSLVLASVGLLASYAPARKATRVDLVAVLRQE